MRELMGHNDGDTLLVGEGGHARLVEQGSLPVGKIDVLLNSSQIFCKFKVNLEFS